MMQVQNRSSINHIFLIGLDVPSNIEVCNLTRETMDWLYARFDGFFLLQLVRICFWKQEQWSEEFFFPFFSFLPSLEVMQEGERKRGRERQIYFRISCFSLMLKWELFSWFNILVPLTKYTHIYIDFFFLIRALSLPLVFSRIYIYICT